MTSVDTFVEAEAKHLLAYFARRVIVAEDAADLLSETLLVIWRRRRRIPSDPAEARMWVYGVARNVLATQRRAGARQSALASRLREELAVPVASADLDVAESVRAVVRELSAIDRELIGLVYWEGFSLQEAAKILHLRPATARSRHARARSRLRERLLEEGVTDGE